MGRDGERLKRFFAGAEDDQGRTLDEILGWDDARLEMVHDYIQWIFPLPERSGANPWAPVLDASAIAAMRSSAEMQGRLRAAFLRMLTFYGFAFEGGRVVEGPRFTAASRNWLHAGNHNHLRLTRMLRSLRVLGLEREAAALGGGSAGALRARKLRWTADDYGGDVCLLAAGRDFTGGALKDGVAWVRDDECAIALMQSAEVRARNVPSPAAERLQHTTT